MALFKDVKETIVANLNAKNGRFFAVSDFIFGPGQNVNDVVPKPVTACNSSVLLRSNNPLYGGSVRVNYDRLDFSKVFSTTPLNTYAKLRSFRPSTIHDLIPDLNDYYGLQLTADDIVDRPLALTDGAGTAEIEAAVGSLGWIGKFTVTIVPGDAKLEKWVTDTDLNGVQYPSGQSEKGQAEVYSYQYDATKYWDYLKALQVPQEGMDVPVELVNIITEMTGNSWALEAGEYSMLGAKITYNGTNEIGRPTNPSFSYYLEILLSDQSSMLAGHLRFHYNGSNSISSALVVDSFDVTLNSMSAYDPTTNDNPDYGADRHNPLLDTRYNDYTMSGVALRTVPWSAEQVPATDANLDKVIAALRSVDTLPWNRTVGADYSLASAWIAYNGPIANMPQSLLNGMQPDEFHRVGFTNVLVFFPPYTQQANLWYGIGYMYYNAE